VQLTWALYMVAVSLFAGGAALLAEKALRGAGRPARWAWVGALVVSAGLPAAAAAFPGATDDLVFYLGDLVVGDVRPRAGWLMEARQLQWAWVLDLPDAREPLLLSWGLAAALVGLWMLHGFWTLRHRRKEWRRGTVEGRSCFISRETGPAVVGLFDLRMVLPEWVRDLPDDKRAMVVSHEEEHLRRHDPWLLAMGHALLVAFAWNPVLWWQVRRLRLAVELDCDRRVTARHPNRRSYGELLLEVGRRQRPTPLTAFARGESRTGDRVRAILDPTRCGRLRQAALSVGVLLLVVAPFLVPRPILPYRAPGPPESVSEVPPTPYDSFPECLNCDAVDRRLEITLEQVGYEAPPEQRYVTPEGVRPVSGMLMQIDVHGRVRHAFFPHGAETRDRTVNALVRSAARSLEWEPARMNGEPIHSWIYHQFPLP